MDLHELQHVRGELRVGHILEAADRIRSDLRVGELGIEELQSCDGLERRPSVEEGVHLADLRRVACSMPDAG